MHKHNNHKLEKLQLIKCALEYKVLKFSVSIWMFN